MYLVLYRVVADKSSDYITLCEGKLKDAKGPDKLQLLYLLSRQYENNGQMEKAREYETKSVELLGRLRDVKVSAN